MSNVKYANVSQHKNEKNNVIKKKPDKCNLKTTQTHQIQDQWREYHKTTCVL